MPSQTTGGSRKNLKKSHEPIVQSGKEHKFGRTFALGSHRKTLLGLIVATVVCLLPFIAKPFNIDDPLFVWAAKQIVQHPLNPYGFSVVWYRTRMPMAEVTKNPPLASYYAALVGAGTNWSEVALHLAFLVPAVIVVVATYELARELTSRPLLAGALTLACPAFLVSATSIMCDVWMLAVWMLCVIAWRKGLHSGKGIYLATAAVLIAICTLTKYFGACLIPLLFAYSLLKQRRIGSWAWHFILAIAILLGYQIWAKDLYGRGLLMDAAQYAETTRDVQTPSIFGGFLVGLSFTGGCIFSVLFLSPVLFRRIWLAAGFVLAAVGATLLTWNLVGQFNYDTQSTPALFVTLVAFIAGGIFALALTALDLWRRRDADSMLLTAWVFGTFIFAAILNWTVNARSVLPLVPAVAILLARGVDAMKGSLRDSRWVWSIPVAASLAISLWLAAADVSLAKAARETAELVHRRTVTEPGKVFFVGHWGFQYYMQELGAIPVDLTDQRATANDFLVRPENNSNTFDPPPEAIASREVIEIDKHLWITPNRYEMGAAFYSSFGFGPVPFAWGRVPPERSMIFRLKSMQTKQ